LRQRPVIYSIQLSHLSTGVDVFPWHIALDHAIACLDNVPVQIWNYQEPVVFQLLKPVFDFIAGCII